MAGNLVNYLPFLRIIVKILAHTVYRKHLKPFDAISSTGYLYGRSDKRSGLIYLSPHYFSTVAIGKTLKLSPSFPPLNTVRATFIAYSAPSYSSILKQLDYKQCCTHQRINSPFLRKVTSSYSIL